MIVLKLMGGLGNQMFQYALGRRMAITNNDELKIDISYYDLPDLYTGKYCLSKYNIYERIAFNDDISQMLNDKSKAGVWYIIERQNLFYEDIINVKQNLLLDGYFQSEKYFKDIEEVIRKDFTLKNTSNDNNKHMKEIINSCNSVSIHFRRMNYVTLNRTCPLDYYSKSVELIKTQVNNPVFFIFSDDIQWTKENFKSNSNMIFVDINNDDTNYEDLNLMKECEHNIIANSTFSWWGAWLNNNPNKIVISPEKWYYNSNLDTCDLIPDGWIKI